MARIALIGGHGKVALLAEPLLVGAGHTVSAIIRNPDHADEVRRTGADPVVADVESMDTAALTELLRGHDVIVWSAGAGGGNPDRTYAVDRDAAIRSIDAATAAGVDRYVMVSYFGAKADHNVPQDNSFFAYAEAKAAADAHLRTSGLSWTVLMPSSLTTGPAGGIDVDPAEGSQVSRGSVAQVIAAVVDDPGTAGRDVPFNDGSTPISEALTGQR